jgi:hypothetical protein
MISNIRIWGGLGRRVEIDGVSGGEEIGELANCRIVELNSQVKQPIITAN